jgi:hypothetical protein
LALVFAWHRIRKQADGAFIKGTKVKDGMLKRLGWTSQAENRESTLGENFQRMFIANRDATSIDLNQTVLLQTR